MIFNDKHEAIACRLLPRDRGQKASYFGCLANPSFSIIIMNGPEQNGTEKQIDIYGKSLMFMSRDLLFHFVEGPRGKG